MSNMISKAKKDYLCDKIVNCGSSRELFRLSSQMMGKFGDTMLVTNGISFHARVGRFSP